jgi:SHS2 domain-containing protein
MEGSSTFPHDADIGVAGEGRSVAEAFCGAARAMFSILSDPGKVEEREEVEIRVEAPDLELLLVRWLNALLAEADLRGLLFREFEVTIEGTALRGRARGERFDPSRHVRGVEVKGATLTALRVGKTPGGFRAQTVVDV